MEMKRLLITSTLLLFSLNSVIYGQCLANAGEDIVVCLTATASELNPTQLGGDPVASGGTEPYTYSWEMSHTTTIGDFTVHYHASDFLSDTTLAHPLLIAPFGEPLVFTLTVTDDLGEQCTDSVEVLFSIFTINLGQFTFNISPGDSIQFNESNIASNYPPFDYVWQPSHGLSDTIGLGIWASPDTSTMYYTIVTDANGCVDTGGVYFIINVIPTNVQDHTNQKVLVRCYPNPAQDMFVMEVTPMRNEQLNFEIYDISGRLVWSKESTLHRQEVDTKTLPSSGTYLYKVSRKNKILGSGQIVTQ